MVFGATGQTGRLLVERAVSAGHATTAFARVPARMGTAVGSVRVVQGDVLNAAAVGHAVAGQDAILSALGTAARGSPPVLPDGIRHILDAMEGHGVRRIVALSAAGALHEPAGSALGGFGLALARAT
ncbi:MAG TPA: NAD(P)H-binding protein, partial [Thermoplasmata archaeon]|nr:NAD(P)H-binding protein [Thermoplasmata archaeon]